jgi:predicted methyltransferase
MDHVAPAGTPTTSGNDLHRIDPLPVKAMATTAGFALDEESPLLANPADDSHQGRLRSRPCRARQTSSCCATKNRRIC